MSHAAFPDGHFYSPVVDVDDVRRRAESIWPAAASHVAGIDFNDASHRAILAQAFPRYIADYDYPEHADAADEARFFTQNSQFSWLDARTYFVMLRHLRPRRVVEVGAGFSTLLLADVNRRFCDGQISACCIEPYPREFLRSLAGCELVERKVESVGVEMFERLDAGDVLFIDSSHVCKTGSDANFLYFDVVPRLRRGVVIHIHDIFLPQDYPKQWVLDENRSWNEQYVVRALLMYTRAFEVLFGSMYAFVALPDLVRSALNLRSGAAFGGGSLWIRKTL